VIALKPNNIKKIITALKNGAVLVLPTDTVYGLICDAGNKKAVEKIYKIKKRPKNKPLPVFVKDLKMAKRYADIPKDQEKRLEFSWPGPVTFILKSKKIEARPLSLLVYKNGTIGMRVPKHDLLRKILEEFNGPLAQTSANISGQLATIKIKDVFAHIGGKDIIIVDSGNLPKNKPSTIIDLTKDKIKILRK
jgi:L-threonylcarbamoyladenylate synthase